MTEIPWYEFDDRTTKVPFGSNQELPMRVLFFMNFCVNGVFVLITTKIRFAALITCRSVSVKTDSDEMWCGKSGSIDVVSAMGYIDSGAKRYARF
jgi:hypothetical protein